MKERKAPGWAKANRPTQPEKERKKRTHGFARLRDEPTHWVEHATASCPDCQVPLMGGRVCGSRQVITLPRVRARVTEHVVLERTCPPVPEAVDPGAGLERHHRGPPAVWHFGAE